MPIRSDSHVASVDRLSPALRPTQSSQAEDSVTRERVFIGSSTEARKRGIVSTIVQFLEDYFAVLPWYKTFEPGDYTLDTLLESAKRADFALFVFAADDKMTSRGDTISVARDNVILEYGLFTAALGRSRVAILQEQDVDLPVDVSGIAVARFRSHNGEPATNDIELAMRDLLKRWTSQVVDPPTGRVVDGGLGFVRTLESSQSRLNAVARRLWTFERNGLSSSQALEFDSKRACVATYAEALHQVQRRFWTTTFLSSGFWTDNNNSGDVIQANKNMMARLGQVGDVRRLFLIHQPILDEIAAFKEHQILDRKLRRHGTVAKRSSEFHHLKQSVTQLLSSGCQLRVAHDGTGLFRQLPKEMRFSASDSELAIYDDRRVDVFEGGSTGGITGVRCYTPAVDNFPAHLQCSVEYFEQLWSNGTDIVDFVTRLQQADETADARIDYESQWLAFYEFALPPEDQTLKTIELKRVEEILRAHRKWGALTRCLDIGTCTGRYPIFLRDGLSEHGSVIGIDDDMDCLRYAVPNVAKQCGNDPRIAIQKVDFTAPDMTLRGRNDLITCMLGTLSHFARGRDRSWMASSSKSDLLQRTIERMAALLAEGGLLILSTWSEIACASGHMLGIYRESERRRLADWTPAISELHERLVRAGLDIVEYAQPEVRLDLTVCRRAGHADHAVNDTNNHG